MWRTYSVVVCVRLSFSFFSHQSFVLFYIIYNDSLLVAVKFLTNKEDPYVCMYVLYVCVCFFFFFFVLYYLLHCILLFYFWAHVSVVFFLPLCPSLFCVNNEWNKCIVFYLAVRVSWSFGWLVRTGSCYGLVITVGGWGGGGWLVTSGRCSRHCWYTHPMHACFSVQRGRSLCLPLCLCPSVCRPAAAAAASSAPAVA